MKREDKFGRKIFSDKVWNKIESSGRRLMNLDYLESVRKPNLFSEHIPKKLLAQNNILAKHNNNTYLLRLKIGHHFHDQYAVYPFALLQK